MVGLDMAAAAETLAEKPSPHQETPPQKQTRRGCIPCQQGPGEGAKNRHELEDGWQRYVCVGDRQEQEGQHTHSCSCVQYTCVYRGLGLVLVRLLPKPRESISRIFPFALAGCSHPHWWAPAHLREEPRSIFNKFRVAGRVPGPTDTIKGRTSNLGTDTTPTTC